jgi:hypothetical protein
MMKQILPLDSSHSPRHLIHGADRDWAETNCYVDVWIELLHALGLEPIAALPFTLAIDFEGDQWTFFKFPLADLYELYGLDVQELAIWRPLVQHIEEQVARGHPVLVELDSYFLPDTTGTAYQREHTKSTVAVNEIDVGHQRLGYFHNQGYYHLQGADFVNIFHLQGPSDPARLPPYVEFVKRPVTSALKGSDLLATSMQILQRRLRRMPKTNPFESFRNRLEADLQWLTHETMEVFHQYSFATLRQFGACYELSATYFRWLQAHHVRELEEPIAAFADLSTGAKTLQFQLARTIARKKPLDVSVLDQMALRWQAAVASLQATFLSDSGGPNWRPLL